MYHSFTIPLLTKKRGNYRLLSTIVFLCILFLTPDLSFAKESIITVTDFRGKTLSFKKPVSRIVCLIESALSGLYMLGQKEKVIAIPKAVYDTEVYKYYSILDKRIKQRTLPSPGNWDFVSIEGVVALKPDLVIIWASQRETIRALEDRGIAVYGVFLSSFDDVYKEIFDLGRLTNSNDTAKRLIDYTKGEIARINQRVKSIPESKKKTIYFMWAQGTLETSCGGSTVDDLIRLSGSRNACQIPNTEHTVINLETLIRWNPDIIILWVNERKSPEDVLKDSQLKSIKAVKTGQVYELPEVFVCDLWTLKFIYAVKLLAKWAYPDYFKDLDINEQKTMMLNTLYGVTFK